MGNLGLLHVNDLGLKKKRTQLTYAEHRKWSNCCALKLKYQLDHSEVDLGTTASFIRSLAFPLSSMKYTEPESRQTYRDITTVDRFIS